jgi:hypothetical protein
MRKVILLLWVLCSGCATQQAVISTDSRHILRASDVDRRISEEDAVQIWEQTGIYRGWPDEVWIHLFMVHEALMEMRDANNL